MIFMCNNYMCKIDTFFGSMQKFALFCIAYLYNLLFFNKLYKLHILINNKIWHVN